MINADVLVLNRNYQPVNIINVRRAIVLLYLGVAQALDKNYQLFDFDNWSQLSAELGDHAISGVTLRLRIPKILVLQSYERLPIGRIRFSRYNIFMRDQHTCQYCGKNLPRRQLNLDHVIPRSQGGKSNWINVVTSCIPCNLKKGGRTPRQAHMKLIRKPFKPKWSQLVRPLKMKQQYREWLPFLNPVDASYWNTELEKDED